jgi:hypothetical protein
MSQPFLGAEALRSGMTRHALRTRHRNVFPGVYLDRRVQPSLRQRTEAAWLWSRRFGVIGGQAAAALHGAKWVDTDTPIELYHCRGTHPPPGIRCRSAALPGDEIEILYGLPVTTVVRTVFDLGRAGNRDRAIARVDALLNATGRKVADVAVLAQGHRHTRGLRQLATVLTLADGGAESPRETALRLLVIRAGFPVPQTQIEVRDAAGRFVGRVDMGWPELQIALEYDGDQHRSDRAQYVRDLRRIEALQRLGWIVVRVIKEDRDAEVLQRLRAAFTARTR